MQALMMRRMTQVIAAAVTVSIAGAALAGCSPSSDDADGQVTITLAGPNQWDNNPSSFGSAWDDMVARFEEEEPGIKVNTTVLPIPTFAQTLSTQITAGTAPELVFNQAPHTPDQVVNLNDYLNEPSPYAPDSDTWLDSFAQEYFGKDVPGSRDAAGNFTWVPMNLVIVGLYFNQDILDEAGVTAPIETMADMMDACPKIKAAGYTPFAMDSSWTAQGWTVGTIQSMLLSKYAEELNQFAPDGTPGTSDQVSVKSNARAILTGELSPTGTPEIAESMRIEKEFLESCATPNWSGIQGGGAFIGNDEFLSGKAALSYGTNFAATNLADVSFGYGTMPFPTITKETSDLATGQPAQFGAAPGGTSYMIPATTEGEKLDAAIKFLQFVTSVKGNQAWLDESGGIPATADGEPAPGLEGLMTGSWYETPTMPGILYAAKAKAGQALYTGYLVGNKSLEEQLAEMEEDWIAAMTETAADGGWTEDWVK